MTLGTPLNWRCLKVGRKRAKFNAKASTTMNNFCFMQNHDIRAANVPWQSRSSSLSRLHCDFSRWLFFNTLANYTWISFLPRLSDDTQEGESNTHTHARAKRHRRRSGKTKRSIEKMPHFLVELFLFGLCSHFYFFLRASAPSSAVVSNNAFLNVVCLSRALIHMFHFYFFSGVRGSSSAIFSSSFEIAGCARH